MGRRQCSKGGGSFSCYLVIATEGHFILSSRNLHCLLCEKFAENAASPPSTPPNYREFVPISRQEVAILTRLQGPLW